MQDEDKTTITVDLKSGIYPPEATDAFLGNHVFVKDPDTGDQWQGFVAAADYLEDGGIRLTVPAIEAKPPPDPC
jgi:hypothetical protein